VLRWDNGDTPVEWIASVLCTLHRSILSNYPPTAARIARGVETQEAARKRYTSRTGVCAVGLADRDVGAPWVLGLVVKRRSCGMVRSRE
jgi:hypothetical protein